MQQSDIGRIYANHLGRLLMQFAEQW